MPTPNYPDVLDECEDVGKQNLPSIVNRASDAQTAAGYWQGRCEGLELLVASLEARLAAPVEPKPPVSIAAPSPGLLGMIRDVIRVNRTDLSTVRIVLASTEAADRFVQYFTPTAIEGVNPNG